METTPQLKQRRSRILLTLFILCVIATCGLLTVGVSSRLEATREKTSDWHAGYHCIDVIRGDLIRVTADGMTNLVQILGMACPSTSRDRQASVMAAERHMPEDRVVEHGITAQKTLKAWINKRRVNLVSPDGSEAAPSKDGVFYAYASVFGVDIGRKMIQGGQAFATSEEHPRLDEYLGYEEEARRDGLGLWHATMPPRQVGLRLAAAVMLGATLFAILAVLRLRRRLAA